MNYVKHTADDLAIPITDVLAAHSALPNDLAAPTASGGFRIFTNGGHFYE
jgi:hypothetical protein